MVKYNNERFLSTIYYKYNFIFYCNKQTTLNIFDITAVLLMLSTSEFEFCKNENFSRGSVLNLLECKVCESRDTAQFELSDVRQPGDALHRYRLITQHHPTQRQRRQRLWQCPQSLVLRRQRQATAVAQVKLR